MDFKKDLKKVSNWCPSQKITIVFMCVMFLEIFGRILYLKQKGFIIPNYLINSKWWLLVGVVAAPYLYYFGKQMKVKTVTNLFYVIGLMVFFRTIIDGLYIFLDISLMIYGIYIVSIVGDIVITIFCLFHLQYLRLKGG